MKYQTACDEPYPSTAGIKKNLATAKKLMNPYGGRNGETAAVLTYSYQNYVSANNADLASLLEEIAITEMKHHELLGAAIFNLGGLPIVAGRNAYFSAARLDYNTNPHLFLAANVKAEEDAITEYEAIAASVPESEIKELLKRIVKDERLHVELFSKFLAAL